MKFAKLPDNDLLIDCNRWWYDETTDQILVNRFQIQMSLVYHVEEPDGQHFAVDDRDRLCCIWVGHMGGYITIECPYETFVTKRADYLVKRTVGFLRVN